LAALQLDEQEKRPRLRNAETISVRSGENMSTSKGDSQDQALTPKEADPTRISFEFIKGTYFRVIHVDGAWGGLTPQGKMSIAVYSERLPIPQKTVQSLLPDGSLGPELTEERVSRQGIIRELEADLIMDISTARILHAWLGEKIDQAINLFSVQAPEEIKP
jgi:hypothetical protein